MSNNTPMALKHEDLVELRKLVHKAREAATKAQIADLEIQAFQFGLAKKYQITDKKYNLDWQTGRINIQPDSEEVKQAEEVIQK